MNAHQMPPRLLKKADAARYCGLDPAKFTRLCPVPPVLLADKTTRWDVKALDSWLDGLSRSAETMSDEQWLQGVGRGGQRQAGGRKGTKRRAGEGH